MRDGHVRALESDWQVATVPQLAAWITVSKGKVRAWIEAGELAAANAATTTRSRPVYRIRRSDFEAFWRLRTTAPQPTTERRRRRPATKEFV